MAFVGGKPSGRKPSTDPRRDGLKLLAELTGKQADKCCPRCGTDEWDRITNRVAPGEVFNRCARCGNEWEAQ